MIIRPKSVFCELREVKVIRDGFEFDDQTRPVTLNTTKGKSLKDLGIKIEDDLPKYIKEDLQGMLTKWKSVFSTGPTDLGYTTLAEHEIKLSDDIPFKQPLRRIPPSLYEEVREHLKELCGKSNIVADILSRLDQDRHWCRLVALRLRAYLCLRVLMIWLMVTT